MSQYYPSIGRSGPLLDSEFETILKENPELVDMVKSGNYDPIPVRQLADGTFEPFGDGGARMIIANHLGIDPKITVENLPSAQTTSIPIETNKTQFTSGPIRAITPEEKPILDKINSVIGGVSKREVIANTPGFASLDGKERPLVLSKEIVDKIQAKHGNIVPENLLLNANNFDGIIKNIKPQSGSISTQEKINLLKKVPGTDNILLIGANRNNGFYTVTHYELVPKSGNEIKSLLGRGSLLSPTGSPLAPADFLSAPPALGSSEGVLGRNDTGTIPQSSKESNIPQKATRYFPLGRGPMIETTKVSELLHGVIPTDKVNLVFNPNLLKDENALGLFHGKDRMNYFNPKIKSIIELFEKSGKVYVLPAFHEAYHYLEEEVFDPAFVDKLNKETLAIMTSADHAQYSDPSYNTPEKRAAEYRADEFAKEQTSKAGYKSPIQKVLDLIRSAIKKIVDAVKQFIKDVTGPDSQRGFIKMPSEEPEEMSPLINQEHVDQLHALENQEQALMVQKEALDNHPAKSFIKYISRTTGRLPEVTGKGLSQFARHGDEMAADAGFPNSEALREAVDDYNVKQKAFQNAMKDFADKKKELVNAFRSDALANGKGRPPGNYDESIAQANGNVVPPVQRGGIQAPEVQWNKFKDMAALRLGRETFERNIEKVAPKEFADKINSFLIDKVRENDTARVKFENNLRTEVAKKMDELGIKIGSDESALVQILGEGGIRAEDLSKLSGKEKQIGEAARYFRELYDTLLDRWNTVRSTYEYRPVPKVQNYFRHFSDIDFFTRNYGFLRDVSQLPTSIAGETEYFKPGKPFSTAELRRMTKKTKIDAVAGMDNYIRSIGRQIFHIDSLQRGRALQNYLNKTAQALEEQGKPLHLANFKTNLVEYVNSQLAGKLGALDRYLERTAGRKVINFVQGVGRLVGKNIIAGNISAAMSHLVSLPLNLATVDKTAFAKGLMTTLTAPLKEQPFNSVDGVESSFMTRRYPIEDIQHTKMKSVENSLGIFINTSDKFKVRLAVASKYYEGISKGLTPEQAMKEADNYAGRIVGDYNYGGKPNIMFDRSMQVFAKFQLGMNDGLSVLLHDIPFQSATKSRAILRWIQFIVFSFLLNEILKKIRGAGRGLDPIDWGLTLTGLNEEGKDQTIGNRVNLVGSDILGELPFTSIFTGNFPITEAMPNISGLLTGKANWQDELVRLASTLLSPVGGGTQLRKTIQGIQAVRAGAKMSKSGKKVLQTIDQSPINYLKASIFGPTAVAPYVPTPTVKPPSSTATSILDKYGVKSVTPSKAKSILDKYKIK